MKSIFGLITKTGVLLTALCLAAAALAIGMQPKLTDEPLSRELEDIVPAQFGDWKAVPSVLVQIDVGVATDGNTSMEQPYDDVVLRTYQNTAGDTVMVAVAYGHNQRQEAKIHRPEVCYAASGLQVQSLQPMVFDIDTPSGAPVAGKRMIAAKGRDHQEAVSYWIRIGEQYAQDGLGTRFHIMMEGMNGRRTDGVLVRVSQRVRPTDDAEKSFMLQKQFAKQLMAAVADADRPLFIR